MTEETRRLMVYYQKEKKKKKKSVHILVKQIFQQVVVTDYISTGWRLCKVEHCWRSCIYCRLTMRDELWHKRCNIPVQFAIIPDVWRWKSSVFAELIDIYHVCRATVAPSTAYWPVHEQQNTHSTGFGYETTCLTLLRICPEVDTFLMSFCGPSCSPSLSDDSSTTGPDPPTAPMAGSPEGDAAGFSGSCGEESQHSRLWARSAAPFLSTGMRELDNGWKAVLLAVMLLRFSAQPRATRHSLSPIF